MSGPISLPAVESRAGLIDRDRLLGGVPTVHQDIVQLLELLRASYAAMRAVESLAIVGAIRLKEARRESVSEEYAKAPNAADADALALLKGITDKLRKANA